MPLEMELPLVDSRKARDVTGIAGRGLFSNEGPAISGELSSVAGNRCLRGRQKENVLGWHARNHSTISPRRQQRGRP